MLEDTENSLALKEKEEVHASSVARTGWPASMDMEGVDAQEVVGTLRLAVALRAVLALLLSYSLTAELRLQDRP